MMNWVGWGGVDYCAWGVVWVVNTLQSFHVMQECNCESVFVGFSANNGYIIYLVILENVKYIYILYFSSYIYIVNIKYSIFI